MSLDAAQPSLLTDRQRHLLALLATPYPKKCPPREQCRALPPRVRSTRDRRIVHAVIVQGWQARREMYDASVESPCADWSGFDSAERQRVQ